MWCMYVLLCICLPICIPVPESAVVLWGTEQVGSLGAFLLGVMGSVLGLAIMHTLSSKMAHRILKRKKERRQLEWMRQLTGRYRSWVLGMLLIVPLISDEVLCVGSALFKIPLSQFLKIGIMAKIISIGMIAFSGSLGVLCNLEQWQIIVAELLLMFLASAGLQLFCRWENRRRSHEGIYIDH